MSMCTWPLSVCADYNNMLNGSVRETVRDKVPGWAYSSEPMILGGTLSLFDHTHVAKIYNAIKI